MGTYDNFITVLFELVPESHHGREFEAQVTGHRRENLVQCYHDFDQGAGEERLHESRRQWKPRAAGIHTVVHVHLAVIVPVEAATEYLIHEWNM